MDNARKPRRVALFVGVDEYRDKSIPHLSGAVADAKALHDFFSSRTNQFDVAEILENPTSDDVLDKVERLSEDLSEGDLFMFYFAGHGMDDDGKQKLLCSNTRQGRRSLTNAFELDEVAGKEKWNVAVILDACRTKLEATRGSEARVCDGKRDLAFYDGLVRQRSPDDASLTILFSCDEGLTAGEVKGKNHGLFTLALLKVLELADKNGTPWCFDQDLGDEIGKTMRLLADNDSGQRPWIRASGTPPLFFLPSMDLKPLVDLTRNLQDAGWLTLDESAECQKAIGGNSASPCAKGMFEAIRFFSNWANERQKADYPRELASTMLKAYCSGMRNVPNDDVPSPDTRKTVKPLSSVSLSSAVQKRLRKAADGVSPEWKHLNPMMDQACKDMRAAETEEDALKALRDAEDVLRDEFIRANPQREIEQRPLRRLDALFSSNAWNALKELASSESDCLCETERALSRLFRLATTCCLVRKY